MSTEPRDGARGRRASGSCSSVPYTEVLSLGFFLSVFHRGGGYRFSEDATRWTIEFQAQLRALAPLGSGRPRRRRRRRRRVRERAPPADAVRTGSRASYSPEPLPIRQILRKRGCTLGNAVTSRHESKIDAQPGIAASLPAPSAGPPLLMPGYTPRLRPRIDESGPSGRTPAYTR